MPISKIHFSPTNLKGDDVAGHFPHNLLLCTSANKYAGLKLTMVRLVKFGHSKFLALTWVSSEQVLN